MGWSKPYTLQVEETKALSWRVGGQDGRPVQLEQSNWGTDRREMAERIKSNR